MQTLLADFADVAFALLESGASDRQSLTAAGREAARRALAAAGCPDPGPLARLKDGQVGWPPGFTGSIAHTPAAAVAAAAPSSAYRSLGIDIEAADRAVSPKLAQRIASQAEREALQHLPSGLEQGALALFACKESIFKCFFPICRVPFWFRDVELLWRPTRGAFEGRLMRELCSELPAGYPFEARCALDRGWLIAFTAMHAA